MKRIITSILAATVLTTSIAGTALAAGSAQSDVFQPRQQMTQQQTMENQQNSGAQPMFGMQAPGAQQAQSGLQGFFDPQMSGHTWGHMVYLIDDQYLFTGDIIWFGADGGYSFISTLAEDNDTETQARMVWLKKKK